MKKKKIIFISLLISCFSLTVFAQQSVNASGSNAVGTGGSASYSVGQVAYKTYTGSNGSEAQGVQQAFEVSVLGENQFPEIELQIGVYPNPTYEVVSLMIENHNLDNLMYSLFDVSGKTLIVNKPTGNQTNIDMTNYQSAVYFLKIYENNNELKTFKIIKK